MSLWILKQCLLWSGWFMCNNAAYTAISENTFVMNWHFTVIKVSITPLLGVLDFLLCQTCLDLSVPKIAIQKQCDDFSFSRKNAKGWIREPIYHAFYFFFDIYVIHYCINLCCFSYFRKKTHKITLWKENQCLIVSNQWLKCRTLT